MNQKKLINKFLQNKCSASEAKLVEDLLSQNPEILNKILSEKDWEQHISSYERKDNPLRYTTRIILSILFLLSANLLLNRKNNQINSYLDTNKFYSNYTKNEQKIILEDSSILIVQPHSIFIANIHPTSALRYLKLIDGEISIHVKKNKFKPFICEHGDLRTTALGTEFTLTNLPISATSTVFLKEGKIKVEKISNTAENYILSPGHQITQDRNVLTFTNTNKAQFRSSKNDKDIRTNVYTRSANIITTNQEIIMNKVSLAETLDFINHELDMAIAYSQKDIKDYQVAGRFIISDLSKAKNKTQAVQQILDLITEVNPLQIIKKHNTYILFTKNPN